MRNLKKELLRKQNKVNYIKKTSHDLKTKIKYLSLVGKYTKSQRTRNEYLSEKLILENDLKNNESILDHYKLDLKAFKRAHKIA